MITDHFPLNDNGVLVCNADGQDWPCSAASTGDRRSSGAARHAQDVAEGISNPDGSPGPALTGGGTSSTPSKTSLNGSKEAAVAAAKARKAK